jgi:hypothetical protein
MAGDERDRHRLFTKAIEILGEREATILMAHLPPGGWSNLATKQDVLQSERRVVAELKAHTFKTVLLTNLALAIAFAVMAFKAAGLR